MCKTKQTKKQTECVPGSVTAWYTANDNTVYYNKLDDLVNQYNITKHSSIKMTPIEASNKKKSRNRIF